MSTRKSAHEKQSRSLGPEPELCGRLSGHSEDEQKGPKLMRNGLLVEC